MLNEECCQQHWNGGSTARAKTPKLKDDSNTGPLVHHDSTVNVTPLTSMKHINDTEAVLCSWVVLHPTAQHFFVGPSFMVTTTHVVFHKGLCSEVHGVHSLQEEAVLAVSSGNKRTRIGFVMLFTHMMDCDEATLSVRGEKMAWRAPLLSRPVMNDFPSLFIGAVTNVR